MERLFICGNCGYQGLPKKFTKGNLFVEIILWLFFLVPGLIYSIWRISSKFKGCPECRAINMIPAQSPRGQKITGETVCLKKEQNVIITLLKMFSVPIGIAVFIVIIAALSTPSEPTKKAAPKPLTKEEKIERQFNPWDGSHIELKKLIKKAMNDPKSYEHVSSKYWAQENSIIVLMEFRGNNAFGAKTLERIKAEFDLNGNLLRVFK